MGYLNNTSFLKAYKKIENVIRNRSVLSNKDTNHRNKINTQQEYIDELNKDKIFLIVKTKTSKKKLLVPLISEDRYNSEKDLAIKRTELMISRSIENSKNREKIEQQIDPQDKFIKDKKQLEKAIKIIKKIKIKNNFSIDFAEKSQDKFIKDKKQLEKAIEIIKKIRIEKNSDIDFTLEEEISEKEFDKYNPLEKKEKEIAIKTNLIKVSRKTGKFKETLQFMRILAGRRYTEIYNQLNDFWTNEFRYIQTSESYYGSNKINEKAICPVFMDKESADQFRIDGWKFPLADKEISGIEDLLKSYNKNLKKQETGIKNLVIQINKLEKLQNFKTYLFKRSLSLEKDLQKISTEILENQESILNNFAIDIKAKLASIESLTDIKAELASIESKPMLGIKLLEDKTKLNTLPHESTSKLLKRLLKLTEKTLKVEKNSLRVCFKNINSTQIIIDRYLLKRQENSNALFDTSQPFLSPLINLRKTRDLSELKPLKSIKIISVGLGDFIQYYSSMPRSKSLERVEFLFIPTIKEVERKEVESSNSIKNLIIKSHKKINDPISTYELKGKTFKDYQTEYFSKSE